MKTAFAILVVFCGVAGVRAFFGLPVEIPYLKEQLENAWIEPPTENTFILSIIDQVLEYDKLGTVPKFLPIVKNVHTTLQSLHASIVDKFGNDSGDTDELFRQLKADIDNAVQVINGFRTRIAGLSGSLINPGYSSHILSTTYTDLFTHIAAVSTLVSHYEEAAALIRASATPITSENIIDFLNENPTLAVLDVWPVLELSSDLSNLYDNYNWLVWLRYNAITQQQNANQTIDENFSTFSAFENETSSAVMTAADQVTTALIQRAESHIVTVQNTYNYTAVLYPDYYDYGKTIIDAYLTNLTTIVRKCYTLHLPELTKTLGNDTSAMLEALQQPLMDSTFEAVQLISDTGSLSTSLYADSCSDYFISQILQSPTVVDRLRGCFQSEPSLIAAIYQEAKASLDAVIKYTVIPQEVFSMCSSPSGVCFKKLLKQLPKYAARQKPLVTGAMRRIAKKLHISRDRMQFCTQVVQADLQDFIDLQKRDFHTCLQGTISRPFYYRYLRPRGRGRIIKKKSVKV